LPNNDRIVVMGAGPAGLAAAFSASRQRLPAVVFEASDSVGGISRTIQYKGYYFDLGGHRFFTKFAPVQAMWEEILGSDLLLRPRLSRIYYRNKFFDYPLKIKNALTNLGVIESARCLMSYVAARVHRRDPSTFEGWVSDRFGTRLFEVFFKTYTEKVWGIPCNEIAPEWASQRIKTLSLAKVVWNALTGSSGTGSNRVTSLIEEFHYPRRGPGMMYDRMVERIAAAGGEVRKRAPVVGVLHRDFEVQAVEIKQPDGSIITEPGAHFISSVPLTLLIKFLKPAAPDDVLAAANALTFRNLVTVDLIIDRPNLFPDNWIYVHSPDLKVGRIQNFGNWSPEMIPDPNTTALGLEYFVSDHEPLWKYTDEEWIALGKDEIDKTSLLQGAKILDATVVRVPRAYPVYRIGYEKHLEVVVDYIKRFKNLQPVGRYGMFKYNNADHSMMTALLAIENTQGATHDIWEVNTDGEYHEEAPKADETGVMVPEPESQPDR